MRVAERGAGGSRHHCITRSPLFSSHYFITPLLHQPHFSRLLHLPVLQFDGCIAAKNVHSDLQFAPVRFDFLNHTAEVKKWTIVDFDRFADVEADLWLLMLFGGRYLRLDRLDFFRRGRRRRLAAYETNDALGFFDKVPGLLNDPVVFIKQHHINENVTWPELARGHSFFLVPNFNHFFHRHEDFSNKIAHFFGLDAFFDAVLDLLFLARQGMNDKPLASHDARV